MKSTFLNGKKANRWGGKQKYRNKGKGKNRKQNKNGKQ